MATNYWNRVLEQRLTRRRALASASATGTAVVALSLVGCGSDAKKAMEENKALRRVEDTTRQAKLGRPYLAVATSDPTSFDPYPSGITGVNPHQQFSRLLKIRPGVMESSAGIIDPDLASKWEFAPDRSRLTLTLRDNAKWDSRPPTNGRVVDAEDVVYSWNRFTAVSALRGTLSNAANPDAAVRAVRAVDARTVVMDLAVPDAGIEALIATSGARNFHILPRETEQGNIRSAPRGSGPYFLADYQPSVMYAFERRSDYYLQPFPLAARVEWPIITEYGTALAQFKAGRIYDFPDMAPEDILATKADVPALLLYQKGVTVHAAKTFFGWMEGPQAPFKDVRLRQAFSMAIDRDLWIDTFYNVAGFQSQGLPVEKRWNSGIAANAQGWWIDPKQSSFGADAKYYQHNVAEAKKLVEAAGFAGGVKADANYISTAQYGLAYPKMVQALIGMSAEAGINFNSVVHNYAGSWSSNFRTPKQPGDFPGAAWINMTLLDEFGTWLFSVYNARGDLFKGFDPNGKSTFGGDPKMDDLTLKIKKEFNLEARKKLAQELQQYEARMQYMTPFPGGASGFALAWPALRNYYVYRNQVGDPADVGVYYWIDETKKPFVSN